MPYDHGYPVDLSRQCEGETVAGRRCRKHPLMDRPCCAVHGGEAAEHRRRQAEARRVSDRYAYLRGPGQQDLGSLGDPEADAA